MGSQPPIGHYPLSMIDRIGPFEVLKEVGRGGMGVVYLARDTRLGREVAIKALPEHFAQDPARLERFEREARTLAQLSHPNIVRLLGLCREAEPHYMILEYYDLVTSSQRKEKTVASFRFSQKCSSWFVFCGFRGT